MVEEEVLTSVLNGTYGLLLYLFMKLTSKIYKRKKSNAWKISTVPV